MKILSKLFTNFSLILISKWSFSGDVSTLDVLPTWYPKNEKVIYYCPFLTRTQPSLEVFKKERETYGSSVMMDLKVDRVLLLLLLTSDRGFCDLGIVRMLLVQLFQEGKVSSLGEHALFLKHGEHTHLLWELEGIIERKKVRTKSWMRRKWARIY